MTLAWNADNCLFNHGDLDSNKCQCWFDKYSAQHFARPPSLIMLVIAVRLWWRWHKGGTDKLSSAFFWKVLVVVNLLHLLDDTLNNTVGWSIENCMSGKAYYDGDSLQNYLSDILLGIVGSLLAAILYFRWKVDSANVALFMSLCWQATGYLLYCILAKL